MKKLLLIIMALSMLLLSGCASTGNDLDLDSKVFSFTAVSVVNNHNEGSFNNNTNDKRDGR